MKAEMDLLFEMGFTQRQDVKWLTGPAQRRSSISDTNELEPPAPSRPSCDGVPMKQLRAWPTRSGHDQPSKGRQIDRRALTEAYAAS